MLGLAVELLGGIQKSAKQGHQDPQLLPSQINMEAHRPYIEDQSLIRGPLHFHFHLEECMGQKSNIPKTQPRLL